MSNYDIIESLLETEDTTILKQAEDIIRTIDEKNGDVNHFLHHLGNAMAEEIANTQEQIWDF